MTQKAPREQRRCPDCGQILPSMDEKIDHMGEVHDVFNRATEDYYVVLDRSVLVEAMDEDVIVTDLPGNLKVKLNAAVQSDPLE